MQVEGGCYCGSIRYRIDGDPLVKGQCHCRACQIMAGGAPNLFVAVPVPAFAYTKGTPARFTHPDVANAVSRDFCPTCGTQLVTRRPGFDAVIVKVGTFDDPSLFKGPRVALCVDEAQAFHQIADGVQPFSGIPTA